MLKKLMLFVFGLIAFNTYAQVVPNLDWVKYYSDRNFMDNVPTTLDANSKVYTAGYTHNGSDKDLVVLCYDSLGVLLWSDTYATSGDDYGTSIRVDNTNGYTYVTGVTVGSGMDVVTIVYDNTGTRIFDVTYDRAGNDDEGVDIQYDGTYAYVLSTTTDGSYNKDITVIQYDLSGNIVYTYDYTGNGFDDFGVGLVLSSGGDVLAIGNCSTGTNLEVHGFVLDPSGNLSTFNKFTGTGSGDHTAAQMIIDQNDEVVFCGVMNNSTTNDDYFTIKCDAGFNLIWQQDYDVSNGYEYATSLAKDSSLNIAVTGFVNNGGIYEYHTHLYDANGTPLFSTPNIENTGIAGLYIKPRVAFDTVAHHIYVSGAIANASNDVSVYQIAPSGNTKWRQNFDGSANGHDAGTGMAVSGLGIIYLSALCTNTAAGFDITTIRISQTPVYFPVDLLNEPPSDQYLFTQNNGQLIEPNGTSVPNSVVDFYTENTTPNWLFKDNKMSFIYAHYDNAMDSDDSLHKVDVEFVKTNNLSKLRYFDEVETKKSYFMSTIPNSAVTNVKSTRRLMVPNIYPSIDLHYYSNVDGLKYYFVVKPGGNPQDIVHKFNGATTTTINGSGDLLINTFLGTTKIEKANVYQVGFVANNYTILPITTWTASWVNSGTDTYSLNIGSYNPALPIVYEFDQGNSIVSGAAVDNMAWNTYVGGGKNEEIIDLELDVHGNIYTLEETNSQQYFIYPNYYVGTPVDFVDGAIVHRFNKYGQLESQTYVGASGGVKPSGMVVLSDTSVVLVGTASSTLPTIPSFTNPVTSYTNTTGASFIFKFADLNLVTVAWSTKYPGVLSDVDRNSTDEIYVVGRAFKTGADAAYLLPKTNALNLGYANISNTQANVVTRFDKTGIPNWSSFIPSYGTQAIKVDRKRNNYYVFGQLSDTSDFEHFNHYGTFYQPVKKSNQDAYIQKFNSGDSIKVSTLYGGNADDGLGDIEILSDGTACMVGRTASSDYSSISFNPNNGSYFHVSGSLPNYYKGWLTKFDSIMSRKWAITYGDSIKQTGFAAIVKDDNNNIYIGGNGYGMQTVNLGGAYYQATTSQNNAIFLMFDANNQRKWATYHGASAWSQSGVRGIGYNNVTHELCYGGGAGVGHSGYPFRNFTTPVQAYWQPMTYSLGTTDAFVGRFNFTGIVGIKENQIAKAKEYNSLFIYPNPTNDKVNIQLEKQLTKPYTVTVYNSIGQLVFTEFIKETDNNLHTLDVSYLKTGIYFINLNSVEINKTAKLIKE